MATQVQIDSSSVVSAFPHRPFRGISLTRLIVAALAMVLLTTGCHKLIRPEVETRPVPAPHQSDSFGEVGAYFEIDPFEADSARVTLPLPPKSVVWHQAASIRLARWLPESRRFQILPRSRYDVQSGELRAHVPQGGTYGVFARSRIPFVRDLQDRMCLGELGGPTLDVPFDDQICKVILCRGFDPGAWSRAIGEQTGVPVGPGRVESHFGDLCDRCLGRGGIGLPECGIRPGRPDRPVTPPTLEKLHVDIPWGGRAVAIAVDPLDDANIIVASETGGLFKSTDGGEHWNHVSADSTFDFSDVQYLPADPDIVIATAERDTKVESGGGIWRSTDAGESWSRVSVTPPVSDCLDDFAAYALDYEADRGRLWAGTECGVAYSEDDGENWTYLPAGTNYNHDRTRVIVAPESDHIKIITDDRVKTTEDGGSSWQVSSSGLPPAINSSMHNQLAVSSRNHEHLFWAFKYYDDGGHSRVYMSTDNGANWEPVIEPKGRSRPPFIRIGDSLEGSADQYDLYFSNGGCYFGRTTVTPGVTPTSSGWTSLSVDHCDASDLAFRNDGRTPWLLASDGGLHDTDDDGATWHATGAGYDGYNALQITEVIGQRHERGPGNDLYFGTQDNLVWASPDEGRSWPGKRRWEGFHLDVPRESTPHDETRVSGTTCAACGEFIAEPILTNQDTFPFNPEHPDEDFAYIAALDGLIRNTGGTVIGEAGKVSYDQDGDWQAVSLTRTYADPVVIAQIMTFNGGQASHARLRNITTVGFDVKVEEWKYLDGGHADETIGFVVLEAGRHDLPGGGTLEAGTLDADTGWKTIDFGDFADVPALLSRVQTFDGEDPVVTRHRNLGTGDVEVRLQEENDGFHVTESVGYVVGISDSSLEFREGAAHTDERWSSQPFDFGYADPPVVVSTITSFNGIHTAGLRMRGLDSSHFELMVEDEMSVDGTPRLVKHRHYLQNTRSEDQAVFNVSSDNARTWRQRYRFTRNVEDVPKLAGDDDNPTAFTAVRIPGSLPGGGERLGIKRIDNVLSGTPMLSDVTGFGSLGTFATMFAWYKPFGVDPDDPGFMIVPDVTDSKVKVRESASSPWVVDTELTDLVTHSGRFEFDWLTRYGARFVQVDTIAFDPTCDGHIMVGTRQAGAIQSFDDGDSWERIPGTEIVPRISSFYYTGDGEAVMSSYGRGLWRVRYDCPGSTTIRIPPVLRLPRPIVYWKGSRWPLAATDMAACTDCRFYLAEGGAVLGFRAGPDGLLREAVVSDGKMRGHDAGDGPSQATFKTTRVDHHSPLYEDEELRKLLKAGNQVGGVLVADGRLEGLLVADGPIKPDQLPEERKPEPRISLNMASLHGIGHEDAADIVITGHNFDPDHPIQVSVDGEPMKTVKQIRFMEDGRFELEVSPILEIGGHTITVRQHTDEGLLRDVAGFNVTVQDHVEHE